MEKLRRYFDNFLKLNDFDWSAFESCLPKEQIKNKSQILTPGVTCDFIAFVQEGWFRFFYNKEGEEKITAFSFNGYFVTSYRRFLIGKPSDHYTEAMEDSVIYKINLHEL